MVAVPVAVPPDVYRLLLSDDEGNGGTILLRSSPVRGEYPADVK